MEGADQILALARIDRGLAADRANRPGRARLVGTAIEAAAALQQRRGEAGEIADHAAAERDDMVAAPDPRLEQRVEQPFRLRQLFESSRPAQTRILPAKSAPKSIRPAGARDILVGHEEQPAAGQARPGRAGRSPIAAHRLRPARRGCGRRSARAGRLALHPDMGLGVDRVADSASSPSRARGSGRVEQRPVRAAADALGQHLDVAVEPDRGAARRGSARGSLVHEGAAAGRDHLRAGRRSAGRSPAARRRGNGPRRTVRRSRRC